MDINEDLVSQELANRPTLQDPIPEEGTLLVKSSFMEQKEYVKCIVGFGLEVVTNEDGDKVIQITNNPQAPIGRRLMSPIGSPFTQGII